MTRLATQTFKCLRLLPRAVVIMLVIAAPVLALPSIRTSEGTTIDAPTLKKTGAGFVLMVSLQRA